MGDYQKVWREFERNEVTHSAAHYLLAVAAFGKSGRDPRAVDIARTLDVSRAAVSLQIRALRDNGLVDVADDHVRLEVQLPWFLSLLANKAKALVQKQGKLMLEKPTKPGR